MLGLAVEQAFSFPAVLCPLSGRCALAGLVPLAVVVCFLLLLVGLTPLRSGLRASLGLQQDHDRGVCAGPVGVWVDVVVWACASDDIQDGLPCLHAAAFSSWAVCSSCC